MKFHAFEEEDKLRAQYRKILRKLHRIAFVTALRRFSDVMKQKSIYRLPSFLEVEHKVLEPKMLSPLEVMAVGGSKFEC